MLLKFKIEGLKKLYDHANAAVKRIPTYTQVLDGKYYPGGKVLLDDKGRPDHTQMDQNLLEPSFHFAQDHGIYMMSNGVNEEGKSVSDSGLIVYAEGCNPKINSDWYQFIDCIREEAGDASDFNQLISIKWLDVVLDHNPEKEYLQIELTKDEVILMWE